MMHIQVTILGEPKGKARPRFTRQGRAYTPKTTVEYEEHIRQSYINSGHTEQLEGEICAIIDAYFPIPKSASKNQKELMRQNLIRPTKKPDSDNVAKSVLDALNGVAYHDDSQIVSLIINKYYSDTPRIELELWNL